MPVLYMASKCHRRFVGLGAALAALLWAYDSTALQEDTVLFLGDSLTAGLGLSPQEAFPALIQERVDDAWLAVPRGQRWKKR